MSEPLRWRDPASGASDELRSLLRGAERTIPMSAADHARTAARVASATAGLAAGKGAVTAGTVILLLKSLGVGAGVGLVALAGILAAQPHATRRASAVAPTHAPATATPTTPGVAPPTPTAPTSAAPTAAAPTLAAPTLTREPGAGRELVEGPNQNPAPAPSARPHAIASSTLTASDPAPSTEDPLAREVRLVQSANNLADGNPSAALGLVAQIAREFPDGQLVAEREFIRARALRATGRTAAARAVAQSLLARFPGSTIAPRARRLLETLP